MTKHDINRTYVSPIDKFLSKFDAKHSKSASQLCEIKKHQRIANLRDQRKGVQSPEGIWESF